MKETINETLRPQQNAEKKHMHPRLLPSAENIMQSIASSICSVK